MKLFLYFSDGFSWLYLRERPFVDELWTERRRLTTLLGYSSTVMPAILTGRLPKETGIWTEYYLEERPRSALQRLLTQRALRWLLPPANLWRLVWFRITRKLGSSAEHRLRLPLEVSHLFSRHPLKYDQFPPIALPGPTLADVFREHGLRVDFRYLGGGIDADAELQHAEARRDEVDVFFYYDPELDSAGHRVGASVDALGSYIDRVGSFLCEIERRFGEKEHAEILLFSDHGMTTVERAYDLLGELAGLELGKDYIAFVDSTFARFWFPDAHVRDVVLTRLEDAPGRFLTADDCTRYGIDFADDRYGQDVLVADEGVVFHPSYFAGPFTRFVKNYPDRAMHGYLPEAPTADGVLFYRGALSLDDVPDPVRVTIVFEIVRRIVEYGVNYASMPSADPN